MLKYKPLQFCICIAIFTLSGCSEPAEPVTEQSTPVSVAAESVAGD